jgi:hypothetical protein
MKSLDRADSMRWIIIGVVAGLAACDRGEPDHPVVVSDSAGETVFSVTSKTTINRWTVSDSPGVAIAPDAGGATPLFFVTGAHRFDDGSLAVASSGNHELRYYSSDGEFIRIVVVKVTGRRNSAPSGSYRRSATPCGFTT